MERVPVAATAVAPGDLTVVPRFPCTLGRPGGWLWPAHAPHPVFLCGPRQRLRAWDVVGVSDLPSDRVAPFANHLPPFSKVVSHNTLGRHPGDPDVRTYFQNGPFSFHVLAHRFFSSFSAPALPMPRCHVVFCNGLLQRLPSPGHGKCTGKGCHVPLPFHAQCHCPFLRWAHVRIARRRMLRTPPAEHTVQAHVRVTPALPQSVPWLSCDSELIGKNRRMCAFSTARHTLHAHGLVLQLFCSP